MASNWTTWDRWGDIGKGVAIGAIIAFLAIAYSPRLVSALHALGSPLPAMASAPVLESTCQPDDLTTAERVQLEDTRALVEALPAATHRRMQSRVSRDQIGELIAANR